MVNLAKLFSICLMIFVLPACAQQESVRPDFDAALERHLSSIPARDLETFASTLTSGDEIYMIFPDGAALTSTEEVIEVHKEWFSDPNWIWEYKILEKTVEQNMATVLLTYDYRDSAEADPRTAWLVLVFKIENGEWRLFHDQNTRIGQ